MGNQVHRAATALITLTGLALLLGLIGGVAFFTRTEPLLSEHTGQAVVEESRAR